MDAATARAELRAREPIFHRDPPGADRAHWEAMTDPAYGEFGASGALYDREFVITTLEGRAASGHLDPSMTVEEFAVRELAPDVWLATYVLTQGEPPAERRSRRATVWRHDAGGWLALYHQGTLVP